MICSIKFLENFLRPFCLNSTGITVVMQFLKWIRSGSESIDLSTVFYF